MLAAAIAGRGRARPGLWGKARDKVQALVDEHGLDAFEAGCQLLERGAHPVPVLLDQLGDLLRLGALEDLEPAARAIAAPAEWYPDNAALQLASLRRVMATYYPAPIPDEVQAEHDALVAQLGLEEGPDEGAACAG